MNIGVMTIATNVYLDYWKDLVRSADQNTSKSDSVTFFVFTDAPTAVEEFSSSLINVGVSAIAIQPYRWPEATLLRYKIFFTHFEKMQADILMHLDADMIIDKSPWVRIYEQLEHHEICLVRHPGFWRSKSFRRLAIYFRNPRLLVLDLKQVIRMGGLGAWEENSLSKAFVPRRLRAKYYCGGSWFGRREAIRRLLEELSIATEADISQGRIAVWHDESHLNCWATQNAYGEENPELCYDETYSQLQGLTPYITAVRKTVKTR
jgi:hypothetical protein